MIEKFEAKDLPAPGFNKQMTALFEPRQQKTVHWSVPWSDLMIRRPFIGLCPGPIS